jgi:hypothetical protein
MLEKLFWFGLGYLTARYLILKNGSDVYIQKEKDLISKGVQAKDNFIQSQDQYIEEYQGY